MTEIIIPEVLDAIRFTEAEAEEAGRVKVQVDSVLAKIESDEISLKRNWMMLGVMLLNVRTKKYWHLWGYPTFTQYIESIKDRVEKGRTQLYQYIGIAEKLLPTVPEAKLIQMGPSKAGVLKQVVTATGRRPSEALINKAMDDAVGIDEFRAISAEETHITFEKPGRYFDLHGFFVTPDERKEIVEAFDVAAKTDPVVKEDLPDWARRKEIVLRMCREYMATYAAAVRRGEG